MTAAQVARLVDDHRGAGRFFSAAGIRSFALDEGDRDAAPVVCVHGVPASAFVYRKLVPALARRGLRGIAVDLPGLGLAERPADYDYTWTGLGRWLLSAIDALNLERFHLLVHDIGGPIGFRVANAAPDRVRSLTVLNTLVAVEAFRRPWPMEPFAHRGIGEAWLASMRVPGAFLTIMRMVGVSGRVPAAEIGCWIPLLFGDDGGRAFLRIMRSFELTAKSQRYGIAALRRRDYPVQIVWGAQDRMLPWRHCGLQAQLAADLDHAILLPGKHFVQEDFPEEIADAVRRLTDSEG